MQKGEEKEKRGRKGGGKEESIRERCRRKSRKLKKLMWKII